MKWRYWVCALHFR